MLPQGYSEFAEKHAGWLDAIRGNVRPFRHIYHKYEPIADYIHIILMDRCHSKLVTIGGAISDGYWMYSLRLLIRRNRVSLRRLQLQLTADLSKDIFGAIELSGQPTSAAILELHAPEMTFVDLLSILDACPLESFALISNVLQVGRTCLGAPHTDRHKTRVQRINSKEPWKDRTRCELFIITIRRD
ncbi:MAG: hypothetical protein J3Q66DRAFT_209265 [Benniella sp.]|nr:MAG: hypothetical protein J3Q66DRAFT_209265 [Benniella sp.]